MRYTLLSLLVLAGCSGSSAPPLFDVGDDATLAGVVTNVNLDPMAVDGDAVVTIETDDGSTARIFVAARMGLCEARGLDLIGEISEGDRVEAVGRAVGGANVKPCESADHYLRRIDG